MKRAHEYLRTVLGDALHTLGIANPRVILEKPRDAEHGDISTNIALTHAKELGKPPRVIAESILSHLQLDPALISEVSVAGPGFVNFVLSPVYLRSIATEALQKELGFGDNAELEGKRILIEFVSANPSGPLNVVSARAAAVGDTLVRMFRARGSKCDAEFYVNDAGNQVRLLGESVWARYQSLRGEEMVVPEGGYHGEYILEFAKSLLESHPELHDLGQERGALEMGEMAVAHFVSRHEQALEKFYVHFDTWFHESELRDTRRADQQVLGVLKEQNATYVKDGATYLATSNFGDNQDWVIVTSDGRPTYFLPDIAYHKYKFDRGYDHIIDILGPDHHSFTAKMKAALRALNYNADKLEVILLQHVTLLRDGEPVKMSKRAGQIVEMDELIDEVGVDAARYFFLLRRTSTPLDFDIELAKRQTEDNPVYYVQYAHARIESIFRKAGAPYSNSSVDLSSLTEKEELDLLRKLRELGDVLQETTQARDPHAITEWLREVATRFHKFYHEHRVLTEPQELQTARLALCSATQIALQKGLMLCGVSAPKEM
jgi:arginyl-tRNA synthetase